MRGDQIYVKDRIKMGKLIWFGRLKGYGEMTSRSENGTDRTYRYPIFFKVSKTQVLTFVYYAQKYPREKLMGTGCGTFNVNGRELMGGWSGVVNREKYGKDVIHGRFFMKRSG